MSRFIDRVDEIQALQETFERPSSLSLVFGQRRTGKTFLLQHVLTSDPALLYFLADESTSADLLRRFQSEAGEQRRAAASAAAPGASDWGSALTLVVQQAAMEGRRLVLVLDECQYLLTAEPAFASILQRIWDTFHARASLHVVLCGSSLGVLQSLGDVGQPLHGRFDLRLRLRPFGAREAAMFVPTWTPQERLRAYGVFGGLARHLAVIDEAAPLEQNVTRRVLAPFGVLHEAPFDLLRSEHLSSRADADAVLASIACGENRFGAIAARAGLAGSRLDYVLKELLALDLVQREVRFGDKPGSKNAVYRCADPFVTFWFRLVRPNRGALQFGAPERVWAERIAPRLDDHMGPVFEQVVRQAALSGVLYDHVGLVDEAAGFWSRDGRTEIDLVLRAGARVVFVECKWRARAPADLDALQQLRDHVSRYPRQGEVAGARLCVASAGGVTGRLERVAREEGVLLLGSEALAG
jgi:uncharacterized protein